LSTQFAFGGTPFEPFTAIVDPESGLQISQEVEKVEPPRLHPDRFTVDKETVLAEMLLRAKRTSTNWKPFTAIFDGTNSLQLASYRPGRQTIIFSGGTSNVIIASSASGIRSNENFTLPQGSSISLDTEGPFWGFSSTVGTSLYVIELYFDLDQMAIAKGRKDKHERQWINNPKQPDTIFGAH
jgi:hypothetical protein